MVRNVVVDTDMGFTKAIQKLISTQKKQILIGVQEGSKTHLQVKNSRKQPAGVSIAEYAAKNEFGTEKIPQRSFMRSTFDEKIKEIEKILFQQIGLAIDDKITIQQAYDRVGLAVTGMIQEKIVAIRTPPNSAKTIALKGSSNPLIDFGQMIASIRHVVRREIKS